MITLSFTQHWRLHWPLVSTVLLIAPLVGCGALQSTTTPPPSYYLLDNTYSKATAAAVKSRRWQDGAKASTLIVNPPHAASGFDSQRIIYLREAHRPEYFSHSEWVDTPARMIVPLIVEAVENSGAFRAVVLTPSAASGDLRLDTEIVRLQQDFGSQPSHVRFTLRASLVDNATRQVLAQHEFDTTEAAAGDDPRNGVLAANRAVNRVLESLAGFCSDTAGQWQTGETIPPLIPHTPRQ